MISGKTLKWLLWLGPVILLALYWLHVAGTGRELADSVLSAKLHDLDGKPRQVSEWRGQVLVVNLWATWCPPCREEMPGFVRLQQKYRDRGVVFVGIALDDAEKVRQFAGKIGVNYPVLLDSSRTLEKLASGLPFTVVINRAGEPVDTHLGAVGEADLERKLLPLLKKS